MEEAIVMLSKSLGSFCNHLQTNVEALKQSIDRRPIPLDSASSTFIQCLNRRVSTASTDLNLIDSMAFGTVSFEELLGHCNEVFKRNQSDLLELEDRLRGFGYVPELDVDDEDEVSDLSTPIALDSKLPYPYDGMHQPSFNGGQVSVGALGSFEDDSLFDESLSLKNLGISDVSLATLASEANGKITESDLCWKQPIKYDGDKIESATARGLGVTQGATEDHLKPVEPPQTLVKVSKDDYESLPSYMKILASWEDLHEAVEKINSCLRKKKKTSGNTHLLQDEISSLSLGPKARSYLLMLVRMKQLVVETVDGLISYRVL